MIDLAMDRFAVMDYQPTDAAVGRDRPRVKPGLEAPTAH